MNNYELIDENYIDDLIYELESLANIDHQIDEIVEQRIELRQKPTMEEMQVCEQKLMVENLPIFTKGLFTIVSDISKKAGEPLSSLNDISKYPEIVNDWIDRLKTTQKILTQDKKIKIIK